MILNDSLYVQAHHEFSSIFFLVAAQLNLAAPHISCTRCRFPADHPRGYCRADSLRILDLADILGVR